MRASLCVLSSTRRVNSPRPTRGYARGALLTVNNYRSVTYLTRSSVEHLGLATYPISPEPGLFLSLPDRPPSLMK